MDLREGQSDGSGEFARDFSSRPGVSAAVAEVDRSVKENERGCHVEINKV